jgi:hypothetical protein
VTGDETDALRLAADQSVARDANERMRKLAIAQRFGRNQGVPFVCECADRSCREIVMLSLDDYERLREHPCRFLLAAGHEDPESIYERIVEAENGYAIMEKIGLAGVEAARLSPRKSGGGP